MSSVPPGDALQVLRDVFSLAAFRPGQAEVVDAQLAGRDVLSVAPTGSGKSVSYWVPALLEERLTVVVSPLISLMKDQVDRLQSLGVAASYVNSSLDRSEQWRRLQAAARGEVRLLYLAPERLSRAGFLDTLAGLKVARIVVDEAHCISTWGHDFRPDYRLLDRAIAACGRPPVAAFTATATPQVRSDIVRNLALRDPLVSVTGFNRPNLRLSATRCRNDAEKQDVLRARLDPGDGRAIVYCATVAAAEEIAEAARQWGYAAAAYHARLGDDARRRVQDAFSAGQTRVVVATVAFGMGVDFPDIRQVIHYHLPPSLEAYYQEAGRAGRDGEPAACMLLWRPADRDLHAFLIERSFEERSGLLEAEGAPGDLAGMEERRRHAYAKLQLSMSYARGRGCRHARIADYFGEVGSPRACQACDNCLGGAQATQLANPGAVREALGAVRRLSGRMGAANLAAVLGGRETRWLRDRPWASGLPEFGALSTWNQDRLRALVTELVELGLAAQSPGEYPVLTLTRLGAEVLAGREEVEVSLPVTTATPAPRANGAGVRVPPRDPGTFERLRTWRTETARDRGVPPYVVFSDRTLEELSARKPRTSEQLLAIPGIGPAKLEAYGPTLLELLA